MIGYWVVVAMVACALAAVLVAGAAEGDTASRPSERDRAGRRRLVWAALGASDATGEGTPDPAHDNWVARLAAALPPDVVVHNYGVGGSTLAEARRDQVPAALAAEPDVVTCWLVVNDLAAGVPLPTYEQELSALLTTLTAAGCRVIVGNVPDLGRIPALSGGPDHLTALRLTAEHWNAAIARLAAAHGAEVVDLFDEPAGAADFGPDGFHPSPAGHARLAARFRPAVERALVAARARPGDRSTRMGPGVP